MASDGEILTWSNSLPEQQRDFLQHGVQPKQQPAIIVRTHRTKSKQFNDFISKQLI